ncbi:acyltransferase family protein [Francisella philomiragia]|uniref:Acyltransferase family protein n=1 Tax=Francisella philomiragia TaxID=28110 RepID=A0A0B6CXA7_9GAMM|nr:acyltransferase family protein [Francisella philomiragia]AJI53460.1 acyltransferase family protein [Francisella philomiragia]
MKYYKHIDGLRAVAVLSVVFFHLDINLVKSGFLGVDIFFVISGFLITSIIIRDLENKSFSLKNFYLRRMRRILPALITVLIFSTVFAWLILLPQDLKNYSKSLVSALGSFSNLYFFKTLSFGYFSTDATVIPLLHTWSLGIEEQFYIFWPLFLIFAFNVYIGIGWKDKQALSNFDKYLIISLILIVLSLFCFRYFSYFEIYDYFNYERFYYFPLTRAFELLFGCVLAIYLTKYKPTNNKLILELLSIISVLLMLYPVLFKDVSYPSNWTVIACVGAVLYIYAGCNEKYNTLVNRFLSIKPIVFIGLISYSLYLWHWPIIAYLNYLSIEKTHLVKLIVLTVSIVLATLTYLFVEKPFRYKFKASFKKTIIILWIIPIAIACCFALGSKYINNFGFNKYTIKTVDLDQNVLQVQKNCFTYDNVGKAPVVTNKSASILPIASNCIIGNLNAKANILIVGDSHASSALEMINVFLKNVGLSARVVTQAGSPYVSGSEIANNLDTSYIKLRSTAIEKLIKENHYKYITIIGFWNLYSTDPNVYNPFWKANINKYHDNYALFKSGLEEAIKFIIHNDATPVIFKDNASTFDLGVDCGLTKIIVKKCLNPYSKIKKEQLEINSFIDEMKRKYPQIIVVDPNKIICADGKFCKVSIDGVPLYQTSGANSHLSPMGSTIIGDRYIKKYGNPFRLE